MKQTAVFRVTAEICFLFAVLNAFSVFEAWRIPMALFTVACLLLGLVIVRCGNPAVRLALSLLPALCFLPGPFNSILLVFPALAWLYYVIIMTMGHYAVPLYEYRKGFTIMLVIALAFIALSIANATLYKGRPISVESLVYLFAFLVLGMLAMRRMQMGADMSLGWRMKNLMSVIGIPLLAVGLALLLFLLMRYSSAALGAVLTPVGKFFIWIFHMLFPTGNSPIEEMSLEEYIGTAAAYKVMPVTGYIRENKSVNMFDELPEDELRVELASAVGSWIFLGVLLLIVLVAIFFLTRRNQPVVEDEVLYDETEAAPAEGKRRRTRRSRLPLTAANARQLRRIYKTYVEYRQTHGMVEVQPSDTSAQILEHDREMNGNEDAARLRELYIAARYGNPSSVTREQVQEAQACLERIVG